jgi:Swt1-like HEPN
VEPAPVQAEILELDGILRKATQMGTSNRDRVRVALDLLKEGLGPYVDREMQRTDGAGWAQQRRASLPRIDSRSTHAPIAEPTLDTSALLGLVADRWNDVFVNKLGPSERNLVHELRRWRNKWAHEELFTTDDAYRVLDDASRLLSAVSASEQVRELESEKRELLRILYEGQSRRESREAEIASPPLLSMLEATARTIEPKTAKTTPNPDNRRPPTAVDSFAAADRILVIHAPTWKHLAESAASFQHTLDSRVGQGYAIARTELEFIRPGCDVIVLDKGSKRRGDAKLARLEASGTWTSNHVQRYDVHLEQLTEVRYGDSQAIRLNHRGIALI